MPFDAVAAYELQSPTLLAMQPPMLPTSDARPGADWAEIYARKESRLGALRTWRYSWWAYWAELAREILPRRYHWLVTPNTMDRGFPINGAIIDSTTTLAMQVCAAGMWSGLTSPTRPWFKIGVGAPWIEPDGDAREWLEDVEARLYEVLAASNFYNIMAQAFQDVATFGTAPVIMYEDFDTVLRCYLPCAGEYYLAVGSRLTVDTFYREFNLTVAGIVEMFTLEACPAEVRAMWEQGGASWEREYVVAHCIEPNVAMASRIDRKKTIRVVPGKFAYQELYWLKGMKTEAELSRRGFHEPPFFVARWSTVSNDAYGRSPGMDCLGDTKQLQMETRRKGEFIEKLVRPPMNANVEMKNEPSSILPGHITYVNSTNGQKGFWPAYEVQPAALEPMVADIKEVQNRIERCFFVDTFMAISRMEGVQPRNELEITKRDLERLQVLGPFVNMFETEFASPAIQRALAIMERRKLLPPKPPSLKDVPIKIEYVSMMKMAQRAAEIGNIRETLATAGSLSEAALAAGLPSPLRVLDLDESIRIVADLSSYPSRGLHSVQEVAQADAAAAQAKQEQAAGAATLPAVQAAQSLSQTNIQGPNALSAILGNTPMTPGR